MKRIFLIGMPGSGKTTLGRRLSSETGIAFFDLDEIIVDKAGKSINAIFDEDGESKFRELETYCLNEFIKSNDNFILATGGGAPCFNKNLVTIKENGVSLYLKVSPEELVKRLIPQIADRPLLKNKKGEKLKEEILTKLNKRNPVYEKSDIVIEKDDISVNDLIACLKEKPQG